MRIELNNLIAEPLVEIMTWESQVWLQHLCFAPGRRYQLDAPSGNGKTSLIHLLCGLRRNYRGDCCLDGRPLADFSLTQWCELRRLRMAVMFQDLRLFPDLTVAENIHLKTVLTKNALLPAPSFMLDSLGLRGYEGRRVGTLSWGERQRVALVRTLSQPFSVLLLDEPFSHLDPDNIDRACSLIDRACTVRKAGLIMTSLSYDYPLSVDYRLRL